MMKVLKTEADFQHPTIEERAKVCFDGEAGRLPGWIVLRFVETRALRGESFG